jgi:hypothetical protein
MNRKIADNVETSGLAMEQVTELGLDIFKLIEARVEQGDVHGRSGIT